MESRIIKSLLTGYILGEMSSIKSNTGILLKPQEVLRYLNQSLNSSFKSTGVTVDAWYGIFNAGAKKVRFANANHPDPYLIGIEQQVVFMSVEADKKGSSLGININSEYKDSSMNIPAGSKLVICSKDLLEHAGRIGERFDPLWLPQVLETIGNLPLSEMKRSLEGILSESPNGTGLKPSRLALLLEIPQ